MRRLHALAVFATIATVATALAPSAGRAQPSAPAPAAAGEAARLRDVFAREWETRLKEDPTLATSVGRHEYDALLPSMSLADLQRRDAMTRGTLRELKTIDRGALSPDDAVSYDMFKTQLDDRVAEFELGIYQLPWNADSGFQTEFAQLPDLMTFRTARDYDNYVARLHGWPRLVAQEIELMRMGIRRGFTLPRAVLDGYEGTMSSHLVADPEKSVFWKPFASFPATLSAAERERLRTVGRDAIGDAVAGYRALLGFYTGEYLPHARATLGAADLPNGPAYYRQQIRHFTTLDLAPEEIHRIGLAEVDRIDKEMQAVIGQVGYQGTFAQFLQFLRSDPRFYAKTPEELLKDASFIAKKIDGKLPSLFRTLPRLPYTVEPVPDAIAPKYTGGRYVEAPVGGTQPGKYWVNTYRLETRPLYVLEALTLHEAVPGHHLQIARSQELQNLPDFRRYSYISAFGEGWGLYCEWLGLEAGFYRDPYSNFGRLTYEMWRACRLVVDTGIHSMGWTRQQAMDYLAAHTALSLHEVETETDRYISWPAQALSYKLGELKIKELRRKAEQALGERFDVRDFHDAVLGSGSVPLGVLERNIDRYIATARARS
jgi:uncharacterized protein (DUF885 family)